MERPIAKARTFDGKVLLLWPDGLVTFGSGFGIPGVGASRYRYAQRQDVEAGRAVLAEAEIFDAAEIGPALRAVRKLWRGWNWHGRAPQPGHVRHVMHQAAL